MEIATVLESTLDGLIVQVGRQTGQQWRRGPLRVLTSDIDTDTGTSDLHTHVIGRRPYVPGDRVLVASVGAQRDDLIVIGRII